MKTGTTKILLYSTRIQLHDLSVGCVPVLRDCGLLTVHPKTARELQALLNTQRNVTNNLQRKFDDISNATQDDDDSTQPPKKRSRTKEKPGDAPDPDELTVVEAETDEVKRLGRRFVILHGPWLRRRDHIFGVEPDEAYDETDRFKDINTIVQGQLHEIRGLLPEKYHGDAFTKKWLSKSVRNVCLDLTGCSNCSISSLRVWILNDPTLRRASEKLPPPFLVLMHWI